MTAWVPDRRARFAKSRSLRRNNVRVSDADTVLENISDGDAKKRVVLARDFVRRLEEMTAPAQFRHTFRQGSNAYSP